MNSTEYERAVLERFRIDWPLPEFHVRHNVRLHGAKTQRSRQIDVAVYRSGHAVPILLVEAKMHRRTIDANKAGATIALVQDIGAIPTIMVSTAGFSIAAENHLSVEQIGYLTITLPEARSLSWVPEIEKRFAVSPGFKLVSGTLVEALRTGDAAPFQDEAIPYEEWLAVIHVHGGEKTIQWSACVCAGAGGVKVGHWIG